MNEIVIGTMTELIVTALAALLAVVLWSKIRDVAWFLIIIAMVFKYGYVLFRSLEIFGLVNLEFSLSVVNLIVHTVLENLSNLFIILAIVVMIRRKM